jgi:hypothetical protein
MPKGRYIEAPSKEEIVMAVARLTPRKRSKFGNKKCEADGFKFDSLAERNRYFQLKAILNAGKITDLQVHPKFELIASGPTGFDDVTVGKYVADFSYRQNGSLVVEDVKSEPTKTRVYRLKKKIVEANTGIKITEVAA